MKKFAFTLAEIMIVLTVIGVLTAILLPVARNVMPNEDVMKFKKAHNTLGMVIQELLNSDKYYLNGDLGLKPNGSWVVKRDYFLRTFADVVTTKETVFPESVDGEYSPKYILVDPDNLDEAMDTLCKNAQEKVKSYVKTADDIYYYQFEDKSVYGAKYFFLNPDWRNPFYMTWDSTAGKYSDVAEFDTSEEQDKYVLARINTGFYIVKQLLCMDIDEINKGEDPFGYGLRVDGHITLGKRAKEWLEQGITQGK